MSRLYRVVISEDGRHSVWPSDRPLPWGWDLEGFEGEHRACLARIAEVWTDLGAPMDDGQVPA